MKIELKQPIKQSESKEYLDRQQATESIIVLSKLLEPMIQSSAEMILKAQQKISQLIDKL